MNSVAWGKRKMKELYDLDTREVSFVPRGANKRKILVFKSSDEAPKDDPHQVSKKTMASVTQAVSTMVRKESVSGEEEQVQGLSARAQAALKAVSRILAPFKDEITDKHLDAIQEELGIQTDEPEDVAEGKEEIDMKRPEGVSDEEHKVAMAKAEDAYKAHIGKAKCDDVEKAKAEKETQDLEKAKAAKEAEEKESAEKAKAAKEASEKEAAEKAKESLAAKIKKQDDEEMEDEEMEKSKIAKSSVLAEVPEAARPKLEAIFKSYDDHQRKLIEKASNLEAQIAARNEADLTRELIEKSASFTHVGIPGEEIVETLRDAKKIGEKSYERVCKQFETMNETAKKSGMFQEIGSKLGNANAGDPMAQLEALVDSYVEKSDAGKTRAEIYDTVLKSAEGKRLYALAQGKTGGN